METMKSIDKTKQCNSLCDKYEARIEVLGLCKYANKRQNVNNYIIINWINYSKIILTLSTIILKNIIL